jgi:hypothetical protein
VIRAISYTEGSTLLTCQARWDFQYGGRLAGSALRAKETPVLLREGRAWGKAVAAFHQAEVDRLDAGIKALAEALQEDAEEQKKAGFYDEAVHRDLAAKLRAELEHYAATVEPLPLQSLEHELMVPLPSRSGKGRSSRYRLQVFFDGIHIDDAGRAWIVEFKLRGKLSSVEQIANSRQIRYYAWAWFVATGQMVTGVITDERMNEVPKPARWVRPKRKDEGIELPGEVATELGAPPSEKEIEAGGPVLRTASHAKDQLTTPDRYVAACERAGVEPDQEVVESLAARRWSLREPTFLTEREIEEAGQELVSLGLQVAAFDAERNYPVRSVKTANCNGCRFREICNHPEDAEVVDALFDRVPPKRELPPQPLQEVVPV